MWQACEPADVVWLSLALTRDSLVCCTNGRLVFYSRPAEPVALRQACDPAVGLRLLLACADARQRAMQFPEAATALEVTMHRSATTARTHRGTIPPHARALQGSPHEHVCGFEVFATDRGMCAVI